MVPPIATMGKSYPENVEAKLKARVPKTEIVHALEIGKKLGNTRLVNTILLGVLSEEIDIEESKWLQVIEKMAPKGTGDINRRRSSRDGR